MKLNWGKYLIMCMAGFMFFIVGMGVYMFAQNKDEYDHQYYEKGLNYDADYTREKQVYTDKAQPHIIITNKAINIEFTAPATGNVYFKRAANNKLDQTFKFDATGNLYTISIPLSRLPNGPWHLRFEWQASFKQYLYEQDITI